MARVRFKVRAFYNDREVSTTKEWYVSVCVCVVCVCVCVCVCLRGSVNSAWAATCPHQCEWLSVSFDQPTWELIPSIMGTTTPITDRLYSVCCT